MKFLHRTTAILSLALLPTLAMAECPYKNPNYKPGKPTACQVPDGVYTMSNRLSGAGAASNYTVLLFVQGKSVRMLVKDKTSEDLDYIVSPKHPRRRGGRPGRHNIEGVAPQSVGPDTASASFNEVLEVDEYWDDEDDFYAESSAMTGYSSNSASDLQGIERRVHHRPGGHKRPGGKHGHKRPVLCNGNKINICFGPESRRAVAMPGTLTGSVELTINEQKNALNGNITLNGSISSNNAVVLRKQNRKALSK